MLTFGDFVRGTLKTGINSSVTTLDFVPDSGWQDPPLLGEDGQFSKVVLSDSLYAPTKFEVIWYRKAVDNTGDFSLSELVRGAEGSSAQAWSAGEPIVMTNTAADVAVVPVNELVNPHLQVWQDQTSVTASGHIADFWYAAVQASWAGTVSRIAMPQDSGVPGQVPYYIKIDTTTAGSGLMVLQKFADIARFAGQKLTLSVWAYTAVASDLRCRVKRITGSGGSGDDTPLDDTVAMTTSAWKQYVWTVDVPDLTGITKGTAHYVQIDFTCSGATTGERRLAAFGVAVGGIPAPVIVQDETLVLGQCQTRHIFGKTALRAYLTPSATGNILWGTQIFPTVMRAGPTITTSSTTVVGGTLNISSTNTNKFEYYLASNSATAQIKKLIFSWEADARL